ncbi:MAG TPA: helix-turn-helix transcriptional regulator [Chloroflexota bacterium]|nr:helix-turn-helix transcriptional regulator [Chloroflexota bacterium]
MHNRLRELRVDAGLVQGALAARAGVSPTVIGLVEKHNYEPSLTIKHKIAKALKCQVSDIWPQAEAAVA